jgi:hypothetical protein
MVTYAPWTENRIARRLQEHQCHGEGLAGGDDLDDLLAAVRGQPEQPDLPRLDQVEALRRGAPGEQRLALVQPARFPFRPTSPLHRTQDLNLERALVRE